MRSYATRTSKQKFFARSAFTTLMLASASTAFAAQINLANLTVNDGFALEGSASAGHAGLTVGSAGDINGDGLTDVIVSEPGQDRIHIIFGKGGNMPSQFPLGSLDPGDGFTITDIGVGYSDDEKSFVQLGDINSDGYDDIVIGGYSGLNFIFGQSVFNVSYSVNTLQNTIGLRVDTANVYGPFTSIDYVHRASDNTKAILISNKNATNSGDSYVVNVDGLNKNSAPINLGTLSASSVPKGFSIDSYGIAANLGDIDSDTVEELALVAGPSSKTGFVFDAGYQDISINTLTSSGGFFLFSNYPMTSIAGIGDIDNDSIVDFAVGIDSTVPFYDRAYVVYGKSSTGSPAFGNLFNLAGLSNPASPYSANLEGFGIKCYCFGAARSYVAGNIDNGTGTDVDGDGHSDLVIGLNDQAAASTTDTGDTYVLFGRSSRSSFDYMLDLSNANGIWAARIKGESGHDGGGRNVAVVRNQNGPDDIMIGARTAQYNLAGKAWVIYGKGRPW